MMRCVVWFEGGLILEPNIDLECLKRRPLDFFFFWFGHQSYYMVFYMVSARSSFVFVNNIHMSVMNVVIDLSSIKWTQPTHRSKHHHIMMIFLS